MKKMLHSWVGPRPCPQTIDKAGKDCQGQNSNLLRTFVTYGRKSFITLGGIHKPSYELLNINFKAGAPYYNSHHDLLRCFLWLKPPPHTP